MHDLGLQTNSTPAHQLNLLSRLTNRKKLVLPCVLFLIIEAAVLLGLFTRLEMTLYDSWFRLRGVQDPGKQIVIVAIDDPSIAAIGPLPWPRTVHAQLLEKLQAAKVIGFDLVFDAQTDPAVDREFAAALQQHDHVVLASQFYFEKDENGEAVQVFQPPLPELITGTAAPGFANTPTDLDQVVRRATLIDTNTFAMPFPSFGLAVALEAQGLTPK